MASQFKFSRKFLCCCACGKILPLRFRFGQGRSCHASNPVIVTPFILCYVILFWSMSRQLVTKSEKRKKKIGNLSLGE